MNLTPEQIQKNRLAWRAQLLDERKRARMERILGVSNEED